MTMIPIGDFAQADFNAMRAAIELQGYLMDYINDAYFAEEPLTIGNLTYARFLKEYEKAVDGGPVAMKELNRQLAVILQPVAQQVMSQPQQGQNGRQ